ncbi:cytochrome c oxidase assembly factor CtaG [Caldibacillus lycopersici]|uniref:Cytochrome c oxidase assembly factor CtaG n=1 Tax=Perspicuibacillus lycopersici TaxID=1325689 RepID=A0AAE3IRT0_9BACI|nr:cytochrome c oxidase assembly factor CtaG [Perspicuibacillus lycopersici]MCU9612231.1 cytochrome c oxidase assembly factor CtaG [Perspicuibacillus lycopersici]
MLTLSQFGFRALWSPYFFLFIIGVIVLFFYVAIKKRHLFDGNERLSKKEGFLFTFTLLFIYVLKGSPIDLLGHLMFTFHMIQMALLYLLVPQLLIVSIPKWMWSKFITLPYIKPVFTFFTKPLIALLLFNGIFSMYHIPLVFDVVKTDMLLHTIYTFVLLLLAINMWWPLLNKLRDGNQLSGIKKLGYLLAASVLLTPACALIIFNKNPMYSTYSNPDLWYQSLHLCVPADLLATLQLAGPEMFNLMSVLYDQQLGGVIMKILQEVIYGGVLYRIFIEWYRKEQNEPDPILNLDPELLKKS